MPLQLVPFVVRGIFFTDTHDVFSPLKVKKNMNPCPSPSLKIGKMPIRIAALAFYLCVLYYRSPCILLFSLK